MSLTKIGNGEAPPPPVIDCGSSTVEGPIIELQGAARRTERIRIVDRDVSATMR
jgi:hypothetical protein